MSGWYAFDLDATLAEYKSYTGPGIIGKPIEPTVKLIKKMLAEGKTVKILTARVNSKNYFVDTERKAIAEWTLEHIGVELESTSEKDFTMIELYDDRAISMKPNTGIPWYNRGQFGSIYKEE